MLVSDRVERFWESVPRPFMERVLRSLFENYRLADEQCQHFAKPEKANVRPFHRRGLIEGSIRDIAAEFREDMVAEPVRHEGKGFWSHTLVICNDDVALTQNTVPYPDSVVRNSCFRHCYASRSNQLYLFRDMAPKELPADALLYGIIVHGRSAQSVKFPGFVQVRFPKPKLVGYYRDRIDLFAEFPEVVDDGTAAIPGPFTEEEELELEPELLDPSSFPDAIDLDTEQFGT